MEEVTEKIYYLHKETNIEQVILRCNWPGLSNCETEKSVVLLRDKVIPRVKRLLDTR